MIAAALLFLTGVVLVQQLSELPSLFEMLVIGLLSGLVIVLRYKRLALLLLGLLWALVFAQLRVAAQLPENLQGQEIAIEGVVTDIPEHDERRTRFDFAVSKAPAGIPKNLRLSWYYPETRIKAGEQWAFTVKLKAPHGGLNPGGFDYERWLFTEGIGATGSVVTNPKPVWLSRQSAWRSTVVWRQQIADLLTQQLAGFPELALIKALTIGDGGAVSQKQWQLFRKTGTLHLVVISGSHIGLIAALVYFLVGKAWVRLGILRYSPQQIAALVAWLSALAYSALAGFSIPVVRSLLMLSIAMLAVISQRNARPLNTLACALLAVLLWDPLAVLVSGFWLSFVAVALILYALAGRLGKRHALVELIKINGFTALGLAPLLLLFFQQVSIISPVANFVAVPLISVLIVPLALSATLLLAIVPSLAIPVFALVDALLQYLCWVLEKLSQLPWASIDHAAPGLWGLAFAIPASLILLAPAGLPSRWLGLVMMLPLLFTHYSRPEPGAVELTVLDVGQGLAVVITTAEHCLVYDTGGRFSQDADQGQSVVLPFLHSQGIEQVDQLLISHGDTDHIGGAVSLMQGLPVLRLLTSVPKQLQGFAPLQCRAGQTWLWDQVRFTVLSPKQNFNSDNDNSCVLQVDSQQGKVLLTGDIEAAAEFWLTAYYGKALRSAILIAPHHGSRSSSTAEFLAAVQPNYVLVSAGYRSQFGHPHADVLRRYENAHSHWLNTASSGAVIARIVDHSWQVQAWRDEAGHYWNSRYRDK